MAPVKKAQPSTRTKGRKPSTSKSTNTSKTKTKFSTTSKPKSRSKDIKRPTPTQVKTKATKISDLTKPKKHKYTDAQLSLPAINAIVPANAAAKTGKGTGKKRDKVYIDDAEGMMTILALVNAEKEGQIESKVIKARQMEEIREARRKEAEKRAESRKGKFEEVKMDLKRSGKAARDGKGKEMMKRPAKEVDGFGDGAGDKRKKRKSVSFA